MKALPENNREHVTLAFSQRLDELIKLSGKTKVAIASEVDVTSSHITSLIACRRGPSKDLTRRLEKTLKAAPWELALLAGYEPTTPTTIEQDRNFEKYAERFRYNEKFHDLLAMISSMSDAEANEILTHLLFYFEVQKKLIDRPQNSPQ